MSPCKAVKPSKLSGLDGTCAVVDLTDGRSISETKSFWALYREFLLRRFAGAVFLAQKDDDLFFPKASPMLGFSFRRLREERDRRG